MESIIHYRKVFIVKFFKFNILSKIRDHISSVYIKIKQAITFRKPALADLNPIKGKKITNNKKFIIGFILAGGLFFLGSVPLIPTEQILLSGNAFYESDELLQSANIPTSTAISLFEIGRIKYRLTHIPFIENVHVSYSPIGTLKFNLIENYPIAHFNFLETRFYINSEGVVVDVSPEEIYTTPEIFGVSINYISKGEKLPISPVQLEVLKSISDEIFRNGVEGSVSLVDISDIENIRLSCGELEVLIGTIDMIDEKIKWLTEVSKKHTSGYLDLTQIHKGLSTIHPT